MTGVGPAEREAAAEPSSLDTPEAAALRDACEQLVRGGGDVQACGAVDSATGEPLCFSISRRHPQLEPQALAARVHGLLGSQALPELHRHLRALFVAPEPERYTARELHLTTEDAFHFIKTTADGRAAAVVIMDRTTIGMGWAHLEALMTPLSEAVAGRSAAQPAAKAGDPPQQPSPAPQSSPESSARRIAAGAPPGREGSSRQGDKNA